MKQNLAVFRLELADQFDGRGRRDHALYYLFAHDVPVIRSKRNRRVSGGPALQPMDQKKPSGLSL